MRLSVLSFTAIVPGVEIGGWGSTCFAGSRPDQYEEGGLIYHLFIWTNTEEPFCSVGRIAEGVDSAVSEGEAIDIRVQK